MTPARVLLVEDEPGLVLTVGDRLRSEGYEVEVATDGPTGFARAASGRFDLLVLDLLLPGKSGFDICRDLRRQGIETPILILTARDRTVDKILGLKLGGDDYLTKPFEPEELLARCEAVLRRSRRGAESAPGGGGVHCFGPIAVDLRRAEVTRGGETVALSTKELALLEFLIAHRGAALSRHELLDKVWGYDRTVSTRTVDVHVVALRKKIEVHPARPRFLLTVHGLGYRLADAVE